MRRPTRHVRPGRPARMLVPLVVCVLTLGACGPGEGDAAEDPASPSAPSSTAQGEDGSAEPQAVGEPCYTAAGDEGPDYATAVDCAQPHLGEVFGVLDLPADLPEDRAALAGDGPDAVRWAEWADDACAVALTGATGGEERNEAMGLPAGTVNVPDWEGTYSYSLTPPEEWEAGMRQTVCTARPSDGMQIAGEFVATAVGPERAGSLAICSGYEKDEPAYVDCEGAHYLELAFRFDAQALGAGFARSLDPAAPTDAQFEELDGRCAGTEEILLGRERDDLKVMSSVPMTYGTGGFSLVSCGLQPEDREVDVTGSVLGIGDGEPAFVPAAEG